MNNEENLKKIAQDNYLENQTRGQFGLQKISRHSHNGIDNLRVNEIDLSPSKRFMVGVVADDTDNNTVVAISSGILKPKHIFFSGIARYPETGTATSKASIVGRAELGNCFTATGSTDLGNLGFAAVPSDILQMNTSTSFESTPLTVLLSPSGSATIPNWSTSVQTDSTALPSLSVFEGTKGTVANLAGVVRSRGYENDTSAVDVDGIPAHSIAMVVEGGDSVEIATAIATKKTPGTRTVGTTSEVIRFL